MSRSKKSGYWITFCTGLLLVPGLAGSARADVCRQCGRNFGKGQCETSFFGIPPAIAGLFCHDLCKKCGHRLTNCACYPETMPWGYYPTCWRPWPGEWQACPYCPPACPPGQDRMLEPVPARPNMEVIPRPPVEAVPTPAERIPSPPAPDAPTPAAESKPPAETVEPAPTPAPTPAPEPQTPAVESPSDRAPATPAPPADSSKPQARRGKSKVPAFWRSEFKPLKNPSSATLMAAWLEPAESGAIFFPESDLFASGGVAPRLMDTPVVRPLPPIDATAVRNPDLIRWSSPSVPAVPSGANTGATKASGDGNASRAASKSADVPASTGSMANPLRLRKPDSRTSNDPTTSAVANPLR
ncbi:MAG: hypothetical protein ACYC35_14360 [Pirellulales bacterium]